MSEVLNYAIIRLQTLGEGTLGSNEMFLLHHTHSMPWSHHQWWHCEINTVGSRVVTQHWSAVMCECVSVRLGHWLQLQQQQFVSEQHSWHKSAFHQELFLVRESTKDLSRSWLIWIANGVPVRISNNNLRFEWMPNDLWRSWHAEPWAAASAVGKQMTYSIAVEI